MNLTIVGSSCSVPRPQRACSSYLLESDERTVVFDLGTGAFANLRHYLDYDRLDEVVISHMHADHFFDIVPLRYALRYGERPRTAKVAMHVPPGGLGVLARVADALSDEGPAFFSGVFDLAEYDPTRPLRTGAATISFAPTRHYIPAYALRFECGPLAVTYSADTAPDQRVVALARGSDVFLCEATLGPDDIETGMRGHSTAAEAARMAHDAGVGRLVLTHYPAGPRPSELVEQARAEFDGTLQVADDHMRITLD